VELASVLSNVLAIIVLFAGIVKVSEFHPVFIRMRVAFVFITAGLILQIAGLAVSLSPFGEGKQTPLLIKLPADYYALGTSSQLFIVSMGSNVIAMTFTAVLNSKRSYQMPAVRGENVENLSLVVPPSSD
jgi:hypothetical protein